MGDHLLLNKIVEFGGPKSDIFIPKHTEGGGGTGLGNIHKNTIVFTASLEKKSSEPISLKRTPFANMISSLRLFSCLIMPFF